MTHPFATLPENLAAFCALLRREYRFRTGPRELQDAARALEVADLADERAVRNVLRPVLSGRLEEAQVFDRAFERFFYGRRDALPPPPGPGVPPMSGGDRTRADARAAGEAHPVPEPPFEARDIGSGTAAVRDVSDADGDAPVGVLRARYSPLEAAGPAPDLEPADREWRAAAAALADRVRARLSRRWRPARHGQRFDFRRTLRSSLHTGGEVVLPRWRSRRRRQPRFVLLVDGSRSMGTSAGPPLRMAVALTAVSPDTETFAFSTSLRRVTRDVRRAAAGERRPLHLHHAWGGGTTIGACLGEFMDRFGERLVGRETVVVISSDGLDVGGSDLLRDSMARIGRRAAAVVWLNPLAATPGYEPSAEGMRLARPFVNVLAPANDPAELHKVARALRLR